MGNGCFSSCETKLVNETDCLKENTINQNVSTTTVQTIRNKQEKDEKQSADNQIDFKGTSQSCFDGEKTVSTLPVLSHPSIDPDNLISIHDLYNMLNDGGIRSYVHDPYNLLLIDSRDLQCFNTQHIITSKHHKRITSDSNFKMRLSWYSMVIMYGNKIKDDQDAQKLNNLRTELQDYIAGDILVLMQGFDLFQEIYPYLCTERLIETIADRKQLLTYPSMILDNWLYQGRGDQAINEIIINWLKITHIVNITLEHKNAFPKKIKYFRLSLEDVKETNLIQHFKNTSDFIADALLHKGRVLVHCTQGISRSSTITMAYLMKHKEWNLEKSFNLLKSRRSCACPNVGFLNQLSAWEEELFGSRITNIDCL